MNRRSFLRAVPIPTMVFLMGGFSLRAYGRSRYLSNLFGGTTQTDSVLVLVQLNGGNDGLNTVIPRDDYSALMAARSNIAIDEALVLPLSDLTGLHPAMTGLKGLYDQGKLAVVQSVGYPNPNFSHFRATDIWLTGSDSDQILTTGWLGRYLNEEFTDFPNGYPNATMPDPLAIQIGSVVSPSLQGPSVSMGMAITSPTSFYQLLGGAVDQAPNTPAGHELTFIRQVAQQTQQYASAITGAAAKATNQSALWPAAGANKLADQLKIVAQLIAGGLKTRVYVVNLGGFDTHAGQVDQTTTEIGNHAVLLGRLSEAITAFQDDVRLLGVEDRVVGMTFSEFGRRIKSNASFGTDHGSAAPLFLFGRRVRAGIYGSNPVLPTSATVTDNIPMQYDFRSVYASVLKELFLVPDAELQNVLLRDFQNLPLIRGPKSPEGKGPTGEVPGSAALRQNFPNPFNPSTRIGFVADGRHVQIKIFDPLGREIRTLVDGVYGAGEHSVVFDAAELPAGTYYYRLQSGDFQQVKAMTVVR